tara:strand:- start:275 stop:451 length:177 start_codon:yes stop_codon:yes gene_type:complete
MAVKIEINMPLKVVIKTIWNKPNRGSKTMVETAHVTTPMRGKMVIDRAMVERIFPVKW